MKINIILGGNDIRNGYINIDPTAVPNDNSRVRCDLDRLDLYVDNNEAEELIALDVLDYTPVPSRQQIIADWIAKLKHGGTITVGGTELHEVSKLIHLRQFSVEEANAQLYGTHLSKKGIVPVEFMVEFMKSFGLVIETVKVENLRYVIVGRRP